MSRSIIVQNLIGVCNTRPTLYLVDNNVSICYTSFWGSVMNFNNYSNVVDALYAD